MPRGERASTGRLRRNCCLSSTADGDDDDDEEDGEREGIAVHGEVRAEDDDDAAAARKGAETGDRHVGNCWWGSPAPLAVGGKADEEECDKDDDEYDDEAKRAQNDDLDSDEHDVLDSEGNGQHPLPPPTCPQMQVVPAIGSTSTTPQLWRASEHVRADGKEAKEEMEGEAWWQPAGEHHLGFADMPTEIQLRVFSRLTPNEVVTASAVCRHWRALSQGTPTTQTRPRNVPSPPPFVFFLFFVLLDTGLWRVHVNSLYGSLEGPGAYYRDIYIQTALGMRKIQQIYAASVRKAQFCLSVRRLAFACRCGAVRWVEVPRIAPPPPPHLLFVLCSSLCSFIISGIELMLTGGVLCRACSRTSRPGILSSSSAWASRSRT